MYWIETLYGLSPYTVLDWLYGDVLDRVYRDVLD